MNLAVILQGLTLAGILGLIGWAFRTDSRLTRLETILTGANGDNGINGEVKGVRARLHKLGDEQHAQSGKLALVDQRLTSLEERYS